MADGDRAIAERSAKAIADRMWAVREQLNVESPTAGGSGAARDRLEEARRWCSSISATTSAAGPRAMAPCSLAELLKQKATASSWLCTHRKP